MNYMPKRKRRKTQKIKVKYISIYEKLSPEEKLEADRRLESVYDFIFEKTLEQLVKDKKTK